MERPFWEKKGAVLRVCKLFYTAAIITSGCWMSELNTPAQWMSELNKDYSIKESPISVS